LGFSFGFILEREALQEIYLRESTGSLRGKFSKNPIQGILDENKP